MLKTVRDLPLDFRGILNFCVKAMSVEIRRASITFSLCLDKFAQFCGGVPCRAIAYPRPCV
ncbi:hypothetical protein AGR7B_Lc90049 [Agrobacterium deltaense RV3]|nr:hypothetical protein AGR7B_Lc90049 [Agrobacterium deltaense RV3]